MGPAAQEPDRNETTSVSRVLQRGRGMSEGVRRVKYVFRDKENTLLKKVLERKSAAQKSGWSVHCCCVEATAASRQLQVILHTLLSFSTHLPTS
jgi:hypothetical protein